MKATSHNQTKNPSVLSIYFNCKNYRATQNMCKGKCIWKVLYPKKVDEDKFSFNFDDEEITHSITLTEPHICGGASKQTVVVMENCDAINEKKILATEYALAVAFTAPRENVKRVK